MSLRRRACTGRWRERGLDPPLCGLFHAVVARALVVLALLGVIVAGCGAEENEPGLAAAVDRTQAAGSSRIALSGTESSPDEQVEVSCEGDADYDAERLRLRCDYGTESMELVAVGETTYVRGDLFGFGGADGEEWIALPGDDSLGREFSPQALLELLRDASTSSERLGEERVRDADTVRYRLVVECGQAELTDCDGATVPVDVWIGEDGLVRRIAVEEGASPFTVEFYDFGADVAIEAPPVDRTQDLGGTLGREECAAGFGGPISLASAIDVLREHGFALDDDPSCTGSQATFGTEPSAANRTGGLYCFLQASPPLGAATSIRRGDAAGAGANTGLSLQNLTCALLTDGSTDGGSDRLEAAFADLERQLRE